MKNNEEEYEWYPYSNQLAPLAYSDAIEYADSLSGKEIEELGYSSKDDLLTVISNQYTITE
jgi:hypothetical protein